MAGVVRLSSGRIVQKYFCSFTNQAVRRDFKLKQRLCFHSSPFLNVLGQEIKMPSLSPTMTEGTIVQWLKKEGDTVAPGDVLCEIQTDKAVMAFETEEEGILAKILIDQGTKDIKVGSLIALMVADGEDWRAVELPGGSKPATGSSSGDDASSSSGSSAGGGSKGAATGGSVPGNEVKMPALSPTMTEGTIVSWKKKEGDKINPGDALCEIQTDKAIMTFELEEEGILAKILYPEGSQNVKVGSLIALTVEEGEDWKNVRIPGGEEPLVSTPVPAVTGGTVPGFEVKMPSLSPTMTEGQIVNWLKKEGDKINPGDVLCEIQTDKAVMSFEVEEEGILAKILVPAGTGTVNVGSLIALTVEEGKDWEDVAIPVLEKHETAADVIHSPAPTAPAIPTAPSSGPAQPSGYHLVGDFAPAVRALLERYHLTGKEVEPSGRKRKLLKGDVLKYIKDNNLQPKPPVPVPLPGKKDEAKAISPAAATPTSSGETSRTVIGRKRTGYTDTEISTMRMTIAKRLTQSKTEIPHAYSTLYAEIDDLMSARKQLMNLGIKVSVNDFVIKSVASALRECRFVNTLYIKDQITPSETIDISVAVATENGLITPIVKNADQKSIDVISSEIQLLANKARKGQLQLHEFQGGSFTISNLGMFGIREFSAIINPPQCAILAVGGGQKIVKPDGSPATFMSATLSYDSRAMTMDEVAAFMEVLKGYLENPASFLLSGEKKPKFLSKRASAEFL